MIIAVDMTRNYERRWLSSLDMQFSYYTGAVSLEGRPRWRVLPPPIRSFWKQRHSEIAQNFGGIRQHDIVEHDDRYWNQTPKVDFLSPSLSIYSFYGLVDVGFSPAITSATTKKPLGFQTAFHSLSLSLSRLFPLPFVRR